MDNAEIILKEQLCALVDLNLRWSYNMYTYILYKCTKIFSRYFDKFISMTFGMIFSE